MRVIPVVMRRIATLTLVASVVGGSAMAEEPARFPVPAMTIHPGELIKDDMIIDRAFAPNCRALRHLSASGRWPGRPHGAAHAAAGPADPDQCR